MVEGAGARCTRVQADLFGRSEPSRTSGERTAKREVGLPQAETPAEAALFSLLENNMRHHDELIRAWKTEEHGPVEATLLAAELRGVIRRKPGNHYELECRGYGR
jgi:predicted Rossmann fold nucleotide-binding protein DprA/Smf involved in DNA uptake